MNVVITDFYWPPVIIAAVVSVALVSLLFYSTGRETVSRDDREFGRAFGTLGVLLVCVLIIGPWTSIRNTNVVADGARLFEDTYNLTLMPTSGGTGFKSLVGRTPRVETIAAFLDESPGLASCVVEITASALYEMSCNGELREVTN